MYAIPVCQALHSAISHCIYCYSYARLYSNHPYTWLDSIILQGARSFRPLEYHVAGMDSSRFAYAYLDHGLYKTSDDFSPAILLWCSSFSIVGYIVYRLTPANTSPEWETNQTIVKFFTILALIITPIALYKAASFALSSGTDNLMYTMRDQVIDKDSGFSFHHHVLCSRGVHVVDCVGRMPKNTGTNGFSFSVWESTCYSSSSS